MASVKPLIIVAGARGGGTGAATAVAFGRKGYSIALIARNAENLKSLEKELTDAGYEAATFPVLSYSSSSLTSAYQSILSRFPPSKYSVRVALYNASDRIRKPFLETTLGDLHLAQESVIEGSFTFAQQVLSTFVKHNAIDEVTGKRGTLIFTGSPASAATGPMFAVGSAAKWGMRAMSQCLAKEFGPENVHVIHAFVDGEINTPLTRSDHADKPDWADDRNNRVSGEDVANAYVYLAEQPCSAWTWEFDMRPAHKRW
ncbi:hypothetical protein GYMLUDRAFT_39170 [Collybiopsis luxurians FD-317 M1]|nr:hypothetical protein GYMLUDRAFT_39170 [Collybiopsis luxurians FD-317 M1]